MYKINGAIYINLIEEITHKISFDDNQSAYIIEWKNSVDIDDQHDLKQKELDEALDFAVAEILLNKI